MEKISYPPLIQHLQANAATYNQLYLEHELRYGAISKELLSSWIVKVLEPIVKDCTKQETDALPSIFKALYTELLQLLGSQLAIVHEQAYKQAWQLCSCMPRLMQQAPLRMLQAINSALQSIHTYQPGKMEEWISLMQAPAGLCQWPEEFMVCGRVNAWLCGLAHLRTKVQETFPSLPPQLQKSLQENNPHELPLRQALAIRWPNLESAAFRGEAGGFIGWGSGFASTPLVAMHGQHMVVTDHRSSFALFADSFGKVLLPEIPLSPQEISRSASNAAAKAFQAKWGRQAIPFQDISSSLIFDNTLVLTRHSSYFLYLYGWS